MTTSVLWFRRDLRLGDNPALGAAARAGDVVPLFVLDPRLYDPAGPPRQAWLLRSLHALEAALGGALLVRHGDPVVEVPRTADAAGAGEVHAAADFGPYGRERDARVASALAEGGRALVRSGSPYAVPPGQVRRGDGGPYSVYTPFYRAWQTQRIDRPAPLPADVRHLAAPLEQQGIPPEPDLGGTRLVEVGEQAALARWARFRDERLGSYAEQRNRPDLDGTSSMSAHLKYGEVHPRTLLADLADLADRADLAGEGAERFRGELAWREFYADVLWHHPESAREHLKPAIGDLADAEGEHVERYLTAWAQGRTGYPIVDAGMRQLQEIAWVHNRVRMIVASFLVKDLHVDWRHGARYFMQRLRDGDIASNHHGWQWVAGSGTDPAPFFRIFNPVKQGLDFDPDGEYVRRYVPELRGVRGAAVHEPWKLRGGLPAGYPERIVDHAEERRESLRRFEAVRG
ncbi:MAG: DNA photolyase family protein [Actinomycetota bacterium]|nr:DNA photolyase family protein [Actinomycetota bacterium]